MTAREYNARCKFLAEENRRHSGFLREMDSSLWPEPRTEHGPRPIRVLRSSGYLVSIYDEATNVIRMSICRTMIDRNGNWMADITWDALQELKRQAGYGDRCAVEIFPPDRDLVNVANMRHLWILETSPDFAWRKR